MLPILHHFVLFLATTVLPNYVVPVRAFRTTGSKSGEQRSHILQYLSDGAKYVIVASNACQDRHPVWYHNLLSHPHVRIQIRRRRQAALATVAGPEDYARLWPRPMAQNPLWETYARRTKRKIPVVILHPLD